ncbi:MAG TPA: hypothetical protein VH682_08465 [Gemmataceae bacterium]|jgi:hypothetical protein
MKKKRVHIDKLRELGFSEGLIEEAVERGKLDVLDIEPAPDLLQRTIETCAAQFPHEKTAGEPDPRREVLGEVLVAVRQLMSSLDLSSLPAVLPALRAALTAAEGLSREYYKAIPFVLEKKQRPLLILENHNIIKPRWWWDDSVFQSIRLASQWVNKVAIQAGVARSARVVVVSPDVSSYDQADLEAIFRLLLEATSDVWWLPVTKAGVYADQDIVVIGDREVLKMNQKADSPEEVLAAMRKIDVAQEAASMRRHLEQLLPKAKPIKRYGRFEKAAFPILRHGAQGVKESLRAVIEYPAA